LPRPQIIVQKVFYMNKFYHFRFLPVVLVLLCFFFGRIDAVAQTVVSPCDANPFCSDSSYTFPNTSGNVFTSPASPPVNYACVSTQPNPIWYWMQIGTAGTIQLTVTQTSTSPDIDFALYGPFTDLPAGCAAILAGALPIQSSYSSAATETIGIGLPGGTAGPCNGAPGLSTPPAAQVGEVYIVLLTNFGNQPGTISFSQTAGTGSADCGIICGLFANSNGPICAGEPLHLTTQNEDTVTLFNYIWTDGTNVVATTKNPTLTNTVAGNYTYTVLAISDEGDTCTASVDVTINPRPSVTLVDSTNKVLCNVSSYTLQVAQPTPGAAYQWYFNNDTIPGANGFSYTMDTTGLYRVESVTPEGCRSVSKTVSVVINHTDVDFEFSTHFACDQDTARFVNLSEPGNYWWDFGDGSPEDTTKNPVHVYQDQGQYVVRLKMQDLDGCVDSILKIVDVRHPLVAEFTTNVDSVCQNGEPVQFTDVSTGNRVSWNWDFGDGDTSNLQHPTHAYSLAGSKTIRLIITDSLGCRDTTFRNVYVDSLPFLFLTPDRYELCEGDKLELSIDYLSQTAVGVTWDFGDGVVWKQNDVAVHHYLKPGVYWYTVTVDYSVCADLTATDSIVVKAYPKVDLGPDSVICLDGPSILLRERFNAENPAMKFRWNTGETTPEISVAHPGVYAITVTDQDCSTTDEVVVDKDCYTDIPNAFTPNGDGENDYFYPRQLLSKGVAAFQMTVYNRWGQKIFETNSTNGRGWDGKFNGKDQATGVYIYQIKAVLNNGKIEEYTGNVTLMR